MPIPQDQIESVCLNVANGNLHAADALVRMARIIRLADDIADKDSDDPQADMAEILCLAFVDLPRNPFYAANSAMLAGPWLSGILGWQAGDEWRDSPSRKTRIFGFVYREAVEQIAHTVAYLTGGHDHARWAMNYLHEVSHISAPGTGDYETFEQWEAE